MEITENWEGLGASPKRKYLNEDGKKILAAHIRPKKAILMHVHPGEVDGYEIELRKAYPKIIVNRKGLEKKIFWKYS